MSIYCTYITFYRGNKLPPFYIGSSSVERINNGYHGSVSSSEYKKIWNSEILYNSHLFETKILSTHENRKEATEKELKLQLSTNAPNNKLYINRAFARKNFLYGVEHQSTKTKHGSPRGTRSPQAKANIKQGILNNSHKPKSQARIDGYKKMAEKNTGSKRKNPRSQESRDKMSELKKGIPSKNKGIKMKDINPNYIHPLQDKRHSEETIKKMSDSHKRIIRKEWSDEHKANFKNSVSGPNNNTSRKINICNSVGEIMFMCHGNFKKIIIENDLPERALEVSLHSSGKPIFSTLNKNGQLNKKSLENKEFSGWFAVYVD